MLCILLGYSGILVRILLILYNLTLYTVRIFWYTVVFQVAELSEDDKKQLLTDHVQDMAQNALRTLALAYRLVQTF